MVRSGFAAALAVILAGGATAYQDLTFEPSDFNGLQRPSFSGSTIQVTEVSATSSFPGDSNDTLSSFDGEQGIACYDTVFSFNTSANWPVPGGALVRMTDFPDRHLLSEPASDGGIGVYVRYSGEAGDVELSLAIQEAPVNTGDNETYEATPWRRLSGSSRWQYFYWSFSEITTGESNWGATSAGGSLGDGHYDGGGEGDTTAFEAILLRPIPGATTAGVQADFRFDDVHTGARHHPSGGPLPPEVNLAEVGVTIPGIAMVGNKNGDAAGWTISGVGDFNGDGAEDFAVGSPSVFASPESVYLVFGTGLPTILKPLALGSLDGANGVRFTGPTNTVFGSQLRGTGDVNGDGFDDFLISSPGPDKCYLVFGTDQPFGPTFAIESLDGTNGVVIVEAGNTNSLGTGVAGAGDFNADGWPDLIIGANGMDSCRGHAHLIFGRPQGFGSGGVLDVATLDGDTGFTIRGEMAGDALGTSVSGAGDVNGDGIDDIVIGVPEYLTLNGSIQAGGARVIYGSRSPVGATGIFEIGDLNPQQGLVIRGATPESNVGMAVAGAGDVNGDGFADLLVGAERDTRQDSRGAAYLIFGSASAGGSSGEVELANLRWPEGFTFRGNANNRNLGGSVAGAGDVNADGFSDFLIGDGKFSAGRAFLIYGTSSRIGPTDTLTLPLAAGCVTFTAEGISDHAGWALATAGDFTGDGVSDILISAPSDSTTSSQPTGKAYLIHGASGADSASYRSQAASGEAHRRGLGMIGDGSQTTPFSRVWIAFDAGIGSGEAGASLQTVELTANSAQIQNLGTGREGIARVMWRIATNRVGFTSAEVTFEYLSSEITNLDEARLRLFSAPDPAGPWTQRTFASPEMGRNRLSADLSSFESAVHFAIAEEPLVLPPAPELVDLSLPTGSESRPVLRVLGEANQQHLGGGAHSGVAFGDINGDGFDDMLMGSLSFASYVVFGDSVDSSRLFNLANPAVAPDLSVIISNSAQGFGWSVTCGDFNGDGVDDMALPTSIGRGQLSIIYGNGHLTNDPLISAESGTQIFGDMTDSFFGSGLATGDFNGDGIEDILLGAAGRGRSSTAPNRGAAYIILGGADLPAIDIDLFTNSAPPHTVRILADDVGDLFGYSTAAGDLDGDGYDEAIIGAYEANSTIGGIDRGGETVILWGRPDWAPGTLDLDTASTEAVSAAGETRITGTDPFMLLGFSTGAGDVDADGLDDLIVGAIGANALGRTIAGQVYLFYGDTIPRGQIIPVSQYGESTAFGETRFIGQDPETRTGWAVAAGDVNGDGREDIWATAPGRTVGGATETGKGHLIYGSASLRGNTYDLRDNAENIRVLGIDPDSFFGTGAEVGGDFNRDGLGEFAAGAFNGENPTAPFEAGWVAMMYGSGETHAATATESFHAGNAPLRPFGGRLSPVLRLRLGYAGGDASTATATLRHDIQNFSGLDRMAGVVWQITSSRTGADRMKIEVQYLDSEIVPADESRYRLYHADDPAGPWTLLPGRPDELRNEITTDTHHLSGYFALSAIDVVIAPDIYEPDNASEQFSVIEPGESQVRTIAPIGDRDWVRFTLDEPADISARVRDNGDSEMILYLITVNGVIDVLAFNVAHNPNVAASLPSGEYFLVTEDRENNQLIQSYTLSLTATPHMGDQYEIDNSPATASTITLGQTQNRTIHPLGDRDFVNFTLDTPRQVRIRVQEFSLLLVNLYRVSGEERVLVAGGFSFRPLIINLPAGGYQIVVEDPFAATLGPYTLSLDNWMAYSGDIYELDETPQLATTIAPGGAQQHHSLRPGTDHDWATFTLAEEGRVQAQATGASREIVLYLIRFNGSVQEILERKVGTAPSISMRVPAGQYYLLVDEFGADDQVADYTLSFQFTPGPPPDVTPNEVINHLLGLAPAGPNLDLNGDAKVDVADLVTLMNSL